MDDDRLAGLDDELQDLRGRLEAVRRGIGARHDASHPAPPPALLPHAAAPPPPMPARAPPPAPAEGDDEVLARLRELLAELRTVTGESP
jgi:hypothetical protein